MSVELNGLLGASREQLVQLVEGDPELLAALYQAFPEVSEHVGYELFDVKWVEKYGRQILRAVKHLQDVQAWNFAEATAVGMAIDAVASDLIDYLQLPHTSTVAVVALVLLIARGLAKKLPAESASFAAEPSEPAAPQSLPDPAPAAATTSQTTPEQAPAPAATGK